MKRILLTLFSVLAATTFSFSQTTFNTVPPLNGGNGSGGTAFQLESNASIIIQDFNAAFQSVANQPVQIWRTTTDLTGPPNITVGNGWTQMQTTTLTGMSIGLTPVLSTIPLNSPYLMNANTPHRFYVGCASGCSAVYTTFNGTNSFTNGTVTFTVGTNVGYGGSIPNPTFHPRQFNGGITYVPAAGLDLVMNTIVSPLALDTGNNILVVNVGNGAADTITQADLHYTFNGGTTVTVNDFVFPSPLGPGGNYDYTFSTPFVVPSNGTYNVTTWLSDVNGLGAPDSNIFNDTISENKCTGLNGTYTINQSLATGGTNYNNFADAVAALNSCGIAGPVIFDVLPGAYSGQIEIQEIVGADSANTVTFRGNPNDNTLSTLEHNSTSSTTAFTVKMDGCDWIGFENLTITNTGLTYTRVIDVNNGASNNWFDNCLLQGDLNTTTTSFNKAVVYSNNGNDENNSFLNTEFRGGSYSMYWRGTSTVSTEEGTVVENCLFSRFYYMGFYAWYHNNMKVRNNVMSTLSTYAFTSYGFYIWYSDGAQEVTGNRIEPVTSVPRYSMYFVNCDASNANKGIIANNSVVGGDSSSTNTYYALYMSNSGYQQILHNTLVLYGNGTFSRTLYIPSGGANTVLNNIIIHWGAGYAYYLGNSFAVIDSDHNDIYSPTGNFAFFNGNQTSLNDWQNVSGFDMNSYNVDPQFYNWLSNDLHICNDTLNDTGVDVSGAVIEDYDGQARNQQTPDIGADEFTSVVGFSLGSDTSVICIGDTIELIGATDGSINQWSTGDSSTSIWISNAGTYSVLISNTCGAVGDTVEAILSTPVDIPATENICSGASTTLSANINGTYDWNSGLATSQTITVNAPGTYSVTVIDPWGCESTDQTVVTQSIDVDIADDDTICTGDDLVLDAGLPGSSYLWTGGSSSQTLTVNTNGTYGVTVTDAFNCVSIDQMTLTTIDQPVAGFSQSTAFLTSTFANTSTGGSSTTWIFGDGQGSQDFEPVHTYPEAGTYIVTQIVSNQCGNDTLTDTIVTSVIGVEELLANATVGVYPNPTNGNFVVAINASETQEFDIHVVDVQGRMIYQNNLGRITGEVNHDVDLSQISSGVYFVKVLSEDGQAVRRLVIE